MMTILFKQVEFNWGIVVTSMTYAFNLPSLSSFCHAVFVVSQRSLLLHAFFLSLLSIPPLLVLLGFEIFYQVALLENLSSFTMRVWLLVLPIFSFFHFSKYVWLALTDLHKIRLYNRNCSGLGISPATFEKKKLTEGKARKFAVNFTASCYR